MALKNQKWDKIMELLSEYTYQEFTIRDISKKTRIPTSSVQRYLNLLRKEGFLTKENKPIITPYFKFKKTFLILDKMFKCGLIDYLKNILNPSLIIAFGSIRKGEYDIESDIDIFIETTKKVELNLAKFEKKLGHKIQLFIKKNINDLPPKLFNSVVNGIKLSGYFKVR